MARINVPDTISDAKQTEVRLTGVSESAGQFDEELNRSEPALIVWTSPDDFEAPDLEDNPSKAADAQADLAVDRILPKHNIPTEPIATDRVPVGTTLVEPPRTSETAATEINREGIDQSVSPGSLAELIVVVNQTRQACGLTSLTNSDMLNHAATIRANELLSLKSHQRPDGTMYSTVFEEVGLPYAENGENIAFVPASGFSSADIVASWLASPSHERNLLRSDFLQLGIGSVESGNDIYYVLLFTA